MASPWWRSAVVYQVYLRSFADGNGDGTGDIAGLRGKLGYVRDLGVDAVWVTAPNHTSDQHAWFRAALDAGPASAERDRYLFRQGRGPDGRTPPNNWRSVLGGPADGAVWLRR